MGFFDFLFGDENVSGKKKKIFISFAIEDADYRDHLMRQAKLKHSPFEFIDMSVKKKWREEEWRVKCRAKIRRCDGAIALLSKNTYNAYGARWEMKCCNEEGIKLIGMHIRKNDKGSTPIELRRNKIVIWTWNNLENFIKTLK